MSYSKRSMGLYAENKLIKTADTDTQRAVLQTYSLLHCIGSVIPLKERLEKLNTGYEKHKTKPKISHLFYMDDFMLIAKTEEELQKQIRTVGTFSGYPYGICTCQVCKYCTQRKMSSLAQCNT
jgi:hypothetical protein